MKLSELPLNQYGNLSCYDEKSQKVTIPEGMVKTSLTIPQLKKLGIETIKGHLGFKRVQSRGKYPKHWASPILVNLIVIEDEPKAKEYETKQAIRKSYNMKDVDWLFE